MGFLDWFEKVWGKQGELDHFHKDLAEMDTVAQVENLWSEQKEHVQKNESAIAAYNAMKLKLAERETQSSDPLVNFISTALDEWLTIVEQYGKADPAHAKENLSKLSAHVIEVAAATAVIDGAVGILPNGLGPVSSANTKAILTWLGFGAVLTAVAHDPIKIGLLRPYQDQLEMTFRNKRPGDQDLFTAYQQRSLSSTKITDVNSITDELMTKIEVENDAYYDAEISKWGYSEYFSNALKDASTKTLSFGNLMSLASQGRLNRGMAIFSLWGYGLDRKLMNICLDALDQANEIANYDGFRAQVEASYNESIIDEESLLDYYAKLHIPQDVIDLMMPRMRKKREAWAAKQNQGAPAVERDLTVSQIQQAYQNLLMDRASSQNLILSLGYTMDETKILLDIADKRRKLPTATTLKKLPLSDYEKAYKNGLIKSQDVLDRMKGEYTQYDIDLEKKLLEAGKA